MKLAINREIYEYKSALRIYFNSLSLPLSLWPMQLPLIHQLLHNDLACTGMSTHASALHTIKTSTTSIDIHKRSTADHRAVEINIHVHIIFLLLLLSHCRALLRMHRSEYIPALINPFAMAWTWMAHTELLYCYSIVIVSVQLENAWKLSLFITITRFSGHFISMIP